MASIFFVPVESNKIEGTELPWYFVNNFNWSKASTFLRTSSLSGSLFPLFNDGLLVIEKIFYGQIGVLDEFQDEFLLFAIFSL